MTRRRGQRLPSREELELWAYVTRQDQPLARTAASARIYETADDSTAEAPKLDLASELGPSAAAPKATEPAKPASFNRPSQGAFANGSAVRLPPAPSPFNARLARLMSRGSQPIDARLDLHGLTQQDAYFVLRRFLVQCQERGHRRVLIITGKGEKTNVEAEREFWNSERRGVLRRLVPQWLSEPSFHPVVVSFTESGPRHGGSGALYVLIRRRKAG